MKYEYEWDADKSRRNLEKHGVPFEVADDFDWSRASIKEDQRHEYGETRFIAVGPIGDDCMSWSSRGVAKRSA